VVQTRQGEEMSTQKWIISRCPFRLLVSGAHYEFGDTIELSALHRKSLESQGYEFAKKGASVVEDEDQARGEQPPDGSSSDTATEDLGSMTYGELKSHASDIAEASGARLKDSVSDFQRDTLEDFVFGRSD